jgi:DNA-directed RNA polymerase subunit omega
MTEPVPATMMEPSLEILLDAVGQSKFTLVTLTSKRARQLNSYFSELGAGIGQMIPPQVVTSSHKPVSIAMAEIAEHRIVPVYPAVGEGALDEAGEVVDISAASDEGTPAPDVPA